LRGPKEKEVAHRGKPKGSEVRFITAIRAQKLLGQGCKGYQCNVVEAETPETSLKNILVVQEFFDVFMEEISGIPLPREVEFYIDLILGSTPISKALYRMALAELKELKTQLDELLEKRYIRLGTHCGGPRYSL